MNRLRSLNELQWGTQTAFTQAFTYDRWGNRQINQAGTSTNVNRQQFGINTANNRLGVPSGQSGQMTYDASGNLTADTYSRADTSRVYDAENRLIINTDTSNQVSRYTYDAAGKRVRRNINNQETWQVYGIGGELIGEYAANSSPSSVQKEYGYRGGELLVTATNTAEIQWLIGDHLGTPRMIADKTGTLSGIKRHDYLPFGEEVFAGTGGRTAQQGYAGDSIRQKFTKYERDSETNLDFAEARYFSSTQGRFTSADPYAGSMRAGDPQSFNRYSYVGNNPVNRIDPSGMDYMLDSSQQYGSQYYTNSLYELDGVLGALNKGGRSNFDGSYEPEYSINSNEGSSKPPEEMTFMEAAAEYLRMCRDALLAEEQGLAGVVIWTRPTKGLNRFNPIYGFGHVSYLINDWSYSWQKHVGDNGEEDWFKTPANEYIQGKTNDGSRGTVYYLDFGSRQANEKFKNLLLSAYDSNGVTDKRKVYNLIYNNCGHAFRRAINGMGIKVVPKETAIRPSSHQHFLDTALRGRVSVTASSFYQF